MGLILKQFLAIETATEACTVALWCNSTVLGFHTISPKKHAEIILSEIDHLLKQAKMRLSDLDGILVGQGPGSFTGVRMGLSVAQGLCLAADLKAWQLSTLMALALSALTYPIVAQGSVLALIDARMGEVYAQRFEIKEGLLVAQSDPCLGTLTCVLTQLIEERDDALIGVGNGFAAYPEQLERFLEKFSSIESNCFPQAEKFSTHVAHASLHYADQVEHFNQLLPVYLRDKVADKPKISTAFVLKDES